jgi:adenylate cyclase
MSLELKSNIHQIKVGVAKSSVSAIYEFDRFRLDASHLMLYQEGEEVSLTPKQVETLLALVENKGQIVSKDALMERLWGDAAVEESNLIQNIYLLRKVLGDTSDGKPMIETLRKRGYRFNGEVLDPEGNLVPFPSQAPETTSSKSLGPPIFGSSSLMVRALVLGPLLVLAATISVYFLWIANAGPKSQQEYAVLPLKPIGSANRNDLFEVGIADSLIHRLSSISGVIVRPLSATRRYTNIDEDPVAAGREQKVDYILASNYQLADGKIKITAQLINVGSGRAEASVQTEQPANDVFSLQDVIAGEIVSSLVRRPTRAGKRGTENEEAYRLYLQAMYLYDRRTLPDARKSVELLERATQLDPRYAPAWAGKAHAHRHVGNLGRNTDTSEEYRRSVEAANRALQIDQTNASAYAALCENKMYFEFDFAGAERSCRRAIELDPGSPTAHDIYSRFLMSRGRHDEAVEEANDAVDLEPTSLFYQRNLGIAFYYARRFDEAAAQLKRVLEIDANYTSAYPWLMNTLAQNGNYREAFDWLTKQLARQNADEETRQSFTAAFEHNGWNGVIEEQARRFEQTTGSWALGAMLNARLGNRDKAFEYLEKSFERRELWLAYLKQEPAFDGLRDDPRFADLLRRVENE